MRALIRSLIFIIPKISRASRAIIFILNLITSKLVAPALRQWEILWQHLLTAFVYTEIQMSSPSAGSAKQNSLADDQHSTER